MDIHHTERTARIARALVKNAAHYADYCFQLFLWYPKPDGTWEILFGNNDPNDSHWGLWNRVGIAAMLRTWGLPTSVSSELWREPMTTGYVDFIERRGREIKVLAIPDPFPPGWDLGQLKSLLRCGNQIQEVRPERERAFHQGTLNRWIQTLKRLQQDHAQKEKVATR